MHTLTLKVQDSVFDKVLTFLGQLPKRDVEIIRDEVDKDCNKSDDFIAYLANYPVKLENETEFLSRDEAHAR